MDLYFSLQEEAEALKLPLTVLQEPEDQAEETLQETKGDILQLKDMLVDLNNGQ